MATCVVPEYYPLRRWISRSIPRESPLPVDSLKRIRIRQTLAQLSPGFVATINANLLSWLFMSEGETSSSFATTWVGWGGGICWSFLFIYFSSLFLFIIVNIVIFIPCRDFVFANIRRDFRKKKLQKYTEEANNWYPLFNIYPPVYT